MMVKLSLWLCLAWSLAPALGMAGGPEADIAGDASERQVLVMLHMPPPHFRADANYGGTYADRGGHRARLRIARDLAGTYGLTLITNWPMEELGVDCYVMELPSMASPGPVLLQLTQDPRVEWAQPMGVYLAQQKHDPLFPTQPGAQLWHLDELHRRTTGRDVRVAVIDSGIDDVHPDLAGQVAIKENFVDDRAYAAEAHGTAVAGIIAARAGNGVGIEGVAPDARLMALRACWEQTSTRTVCNSFTLGKALNFALSHQAQVINLSLSGPPDRLLAHLLDLALAHGITVVAAVDPLHPDGGFPASHRGVIAVAADHTAATGMDFLLAPGQDVPSTLPGARWAFVSGASFAAAHVSGLLALLEELRPDQPAVHATLSHTGTIDVCATVTHATGICLCACTTMMVSPNLP